MKLLRFGIRFWITITSVISFLTGWIMLAHAPKPTGTNITNNNAAPMPTLEPLRPLSDFQTGEDDFQNAPSFEFQPQNPFRPSFRSGGS